jgi:hypothetical protein
LLSFSIFTGVRQGFPKLYLELWKDSTLLSAMKNRMISNKGIYPEYDKNFTNTDFGDWGLEFGF